MVFESIVVELINRYLGDFVENLDTSQLKIGIWGGDVVLNNLNLKESALDEMDLPVKIKAGHIGNLTLKIPWKNLYTEPVVAEIDGIYALAVPNIGIKYDEEKEKQALLDAKQKKLEAIEAMKKAEEEKDKPKDPKTDSFVEKLATQVIKNLQIKVSNIHVRYEDKFTNPSSPTSIGVTLQELLFQTTDENWKETVIKESVTQIYKLVRLESLAVYWNSKSPLLQDMESPQILTNLKSALDKQGPGPDFQYLFKPISAVAHLRLNTKPELSEFNIPKIFLTLVFDEIALAMHKSQYDDILEILESMERMNLKSKYKKSRPSVQYKGHAAEWWHHAYAVVLEHTVQRRRKMWSWVEIKAHRDRLRQYKELFVKQLSSKKLGTQDAEKLKSLEESLDVLNIIMARNLAETEVAKLGAKKKEEKSQGWFGGWFGGGSKTSVASKNEEDPAQSSLGEEFQKKFDAKEQAKLYKAIGYEEDAVDTTFPTEFVAVRVVTKLNKFSLSLSESHKNDHPLLKTTLTEIYVSLGQRPAANAIRLDAKVDKLRVSGIPQNGVTPKLMNSIKEETASLLTFMFETNPQDGECDSRVKVNSNPVEIIYDALTINNLASFFKPPESVRLKQFSEGAMERYKNIQAQTATGMMHAMEEKKYMDIQVNLMPSYIIVPAYGLLSKDVDMLLLNLGNLKISTEKNKASGVDLKKMTEEEITNMAYDKFKISLENIQLLYIQPGDSWDDPNRSATSPLYVLRPLSISLDLEKCIFAEDANLAKLRVKGELPLVSIGLSDVKLKGMLELAQSIPLPQSDASEADPFDSQPSEFSSLESTDINLTKLDFHSQAPKSGTLETSAYVNMTSLSLSFVIQEVTVEVTETVEGTEMPFLKLHIDRIGTDMKQRTFDMKVEAYLGAIYLQHLQFKLTPNITEQLAKCDVLTGEVVNIINTPSDKKESNLLYVNFLQANKKGPEFATLYQNTAQSVTVEFEALDLLIHEGVIQSLMKFAKKFEPEKPPQAIEAPLTSRRQSIASSISSFSKAVKSVDKDKKEDSQVSEIIEFKVTGLVDSIQVGICSEHYLIMHTKIQGLEAGVQMYKSKLGVSAIIRSLVVLDPDRETLHPQILFVSGERVLDFYMTQFNKGTEGDKFDNPSKVDLDVKLNLGRLQVVFVNKFVASLLNFLDNFAVAKAKLDEAGQAMKEASKDVAKNLKEHATRLRFAIKLKAPVVVIPRNSRSNMSCLVYLGDLDLRNSFVKLGSGAKRGQAHIMEQIDVNLTDLQFSRGIVEPSGVETEISILKPMTFSVVVKRNLSEGWFHGIPDLAVSGVLETVEVNLSFEDLSMLLLVVNENLAEKPVVLSQPKSEGAPPPIAVAAEKPESPVETKTEGEGTALTTLDEEAYSKMHVDFKLVSILVNLFKGSSNLESKNPERVMDKMLTQITLQQLLLNLDIMSDSAMKANVSLYTITMDDMRVEKKGGITKMLDLAQNSESSNDKLIEVDFKQNAEEEKIVLLHLSALHICVCMEFLMRVVDFFTKSMPPPKPKTIQETVEEQDRKAKMAMKSASAPQAEPQKGSLDVTLKMDKPEIILIEDQMNKHTNSLIVDLAINFRLRQNPDVQAINSSISGLSLVSCVFEQPATRKNVLAPCDISLISNAPHGRDHHVDINVTDIVINITPSTIRLLSAVAGGMVQSTDEEVIESTLDTYFHIWDKKALAECGFWFTNSVVEPGTDIDKPALSDSHESEEKEARTEQLMMSVPVVVFKLEGGVGHRTVPLLIVESAFSAQVMNWSSLLAVESSLSLEVAYFNEQLGVWEPIIEPVMGHSADNTKKWELALQVSKNEDFIPEDEGDDTPVLPPPKMVINIMATEPLEVLMTKTCLEVLNHLGQAFNEAYQLQAMEGTMGDELAPYVFRNETGLDMKLSIDPAFQIASDSKDVNPDAFKPGQELAVVRKAIGALEKQKSVIRDTQKQKEVRIGFQVQGDETRFDTSIKRAGKKMFAVGKDKQQVVCFVDAKIGQKIVTFMSVLRVTNNLHVPVEVLYSDHTCGMIQPYATKPLPLEAIYKNSAGELNFKLLPPDAGNAYAQSAQGLKWKTVSSSNKSQQVKCDWKNADGKAPVYFNVRPKVESISVDGKEKETASMTTLSLHPTIILHNLLPFQVQYILEGTEPATLEGGDYIPLDNAAMNESTLELIIPNYRGISWSGKKVIKQDVPELSVWTFKGDDNGKAMSMDLGLHSKENSGSFDISLYSPYWIINMTEQNLELKEDEKDDPFQQAADDKDIMMFFFKEKSLFGSKKKEPSSTEKKKGDKSEKHEKTKEVKKPGKVILKIGDGEWSDKFSLDTVGSSGNVTCKHKTRGHPLEVGVKIILSTSGLTKIVTFTPFYMMLNASMVPICVKEEEKQWLKVEPGECKAFYPETMTKDKDVKVIAKPEDSDQETVPFFANKAHTTLLKLSDKYGGLNADCQVRESAMITTFSLYKPGMATVQFVNQTSDCNISIKQSGDSKNSLELGPMTSQLYTWEDPTGKKEILWSCGDKKNVKGQIQQDGIDEFFAKSDVKVYWVSFLDGMQRVVMFTQDIALATTAQEAGELEQVEQEINMRVQNMGFSLINNIQMVEVAYMGITSSGVIWEEKRKRFKALKVKDCIALEQGFQKYLNEVAIGKKRSGTVSLEHKIEADFEKMEMTKPRKCQIRRSFEDGVWVQYKASPHSRQFHAKINRLQFDNQLRQAIFPTVLSPLPPPKSVAADSVPKPFVEVSLMMRLHEHSSLVQIKYFKVLVQEMNLKVDQGFLNAVLEMFSSDAEVNRDQEAKAFEQDVTNTKHNLKEEAGLSIQSSQASFYDYFHISPIKVHLSFSLQAVGSGGGNTPIQANVLNVFLQSVGVVLTDVQDVVFKLGYFERNNSFYNNSQLTSEFVRHYSGQAIKQMYVLVLGLDVLGNPFGLLRGLSEGIEDLFYEPYQGAIQGPEEFAEGLALGVRSLFGHAVGGAAGAVSRITGTLGKGLAALTLDDDYQKKRREQMIRKPASAKEGFARGGKGLVMGVFDGVTGIVRKPVEGAKQEGVSGFFKGMGKGLVGVVTRPTSGVVDFASSSLEGIRRITDMTEEIHRLRPPRHMHKDGIIRPYNRQEAEGYNLLAETEKGKFADSDEYLTHIKIKEDGKLVFIVTDKRVMLAKRGEIFGSWDTEWVYTYQEMKAVPKQIPKGLEITLKEEKKKKLFGSSASKKDLVITDQNLVKEVLEKISEAMEALNLENGV